MEQFYSLQNIDFNINSSCNKNAFQNKKMFTEIRTYCFTHLIYIVNNVFNFVGASTYIIYFYSPNYYCTLLFLDFILSVGVYSKIVGA